jgi:MFS family permease
MLRHMDHGTDAGPPPVKHPPKWLTRNIVAIGFVSFLTDVASEMVMSLLPAFLVVIGAGAASLGWIEGFAEITSSALKVVSGTWADRTGRHKPLVVAGYLIASAARPLVGFAGAAWHIVAVRMTDRVGKGLRSSPRDALLSRSVPPSMRARAFGFHRAMDNAGAVLGPLVACGILWLACDDLSVTAVTADNIRLVFWLAAVPGALSVLVLWLGVKDIAPEDGAGAAHSPVTSAAAKPVDQRRLLRFLLPLGLFALGNATDLFILARATELSGSIVTLPLMWAALHVVKSGSAYPGGWIADTFGKRRTIAVGWLVYAGCYAGFAFAPSQAVIWMLLPVYGLYYGLTEGPEKAVIAEVAPKRSHGAAFGWYHFTLGMTAFAGNAIFALLWAAFGMKAAFLCGAGFAVAAVILLRAMNPKSWGPR